MDVRNRSSAIGHLRRALPGPTKIYLTLDGHTTISTMHQMCAISENTSSLAIIDITMTIAAAPALGGSAVAPRSIVSAGVKQIVPL
jgi:hypothetical protein